MPSLTSSSQPDFIGTGFACPLQTSVQGSIQLSSHVPNVEESIAIILRTDLGERVYRPNFGSRLSELTYEPLNIQTLLQIRLFVEEALEQWEPRITLKGVRTEPDPIRGKVNIQIEYQLKHHPELRSLVYPFYLRQEAESNSTL